MVKKWGQLFPFQHLDLRRSHCSFWGHPSQKLGVLAVGRCVQPVGISGDRLLGPLTKTQPTKEGKKHAEHLLGPLLYKSTRQKWPQTQLDKQKQSTTDHLLGDLYSKPGKPKGPWSFQIGASAPEMPRVVSPPASGHELRSPAPKASTRCAEPKPRFTAKRAMSDSGGKIRKGPKKKVWTI